MKGETWKIVLAVVIVLGGLFLFWESDHPQDVYFEPATSTPEKEEIEEKEEKEKEATSSLPQGGEEPAGTSTSTSTENKNSPRTTPPLARGGAVPTEEEKDTETEKRNIQEELPFTPQAPFGEWEDKRQQEGCEEASVLMAIYAVRGKELTPSVAKEKILDMARFQKENYGAFVDTAVEDTASRLIEGYFNYTNYEIKKNIKKEDIIEAVVAGNLVIVPLNGRTLDNPYYTPPGPGRHNLVIRGYDEEKGEFITNDPGTKRGENFRYAETDLYNSIRDYPTGDGSPIERIEKNMIIITN